MSESNTETRSSGETHMSVVDRYYCKRYILDSQANEDEDLCILSHSNRICIITLADTHPVIRDNKTVEKVSFSVGGVDRLSNKVSGKGKRGAQELTAASPLCLITCADGEEYTVHAGVRGQLIEVNDALIQNPQQIIAKPQSGGYIAIVLPKLKEYDQIMKKLKTEDQYRERRLNNGGATG